MKQLFFLFLTCITFILYTPELSAMKPKKIPPSLPSKASRQKLSKAPTERQSKVITQEQAKGPEEQYVISLTGKQKAELASYFKKAEDAKNIKNDSEKKLAEIKIINFINNIDGKNTKLYPDYMGLENCPLSVKAIYLDLSSLLQELIKNGANVNIFAHYKNLKGPLLYFAFARSLKCTQILIESEKLENIYMDTLMSLHMLGRPESLLTQADKEAVIKMLISKEPSIKSLIEKEASLEKIFKKYTEKKLTPPSKKFPDAPKKKAPTIPQKKKPISDKPLKYAQKLTEIQKNKLLNYFKEIIILEKTEEIEKQEKQKIKIELEQNIIKFINNIDEKGTKLDPNYKLNMNSLVNLAIKYKLPSLLHELKKKIGLGAITTVPIEISARRKEKVKG